MRTIWGELILSFGLALIPAIPTRACAPQASEGVPWPATDALGRSMPVAGEAGMLGPRPGRYVGMLYSLWHDGHDGPHDISRILGRDPAAAARPDSPPWGPKGAFHYWAEPLYGYYNSSDPWVLRRHAQLLDAAGVDVLILDVSNAETYPKAFSTLGMVFEAIRRAGGRTPKLAFMVNTQAAETASRLYTEFYKPGLFRSLWFDWDGKPLLLCDPSRASPEVRRFFTLRRAHWPFDRVNTPYAWHWEAAYPQVYGYTTDRLRPEQVSVSAAQNLRVRDCLVTDMSAGDARGRSFHANAVDHALGAVDRGPNFQEQWDRALTLDPAFVLVTGWNEWVAGRLGEPGRPVVFVDQFDQQHSRDIEPMKGGHGDSYYYQLVANVRRYKGTLPLPSPSEARSIRIDGAMGQWADVTPEFADDLGDVSPRDHAGAGGVRYRERSGRNDLISFKVARDPANVYFYARTRRRLSPPTDPNWMMLFIDADGNPATGWQGFDFLIGRGDGEGDEGFARLEKNVGGWRWESVARVARRIVENELCLAVPRVALGLHGNTTSLSLDFKWADGVRDPGDIMAYYVSGDVAPEGRFRYRYLAR